MTVDNPKQTVRVDQTLTCQNWRTL